MYREISDFLTISDCNPGLQMKTGVQLASGNNYEQKIFTTLKGSS